MLATRRLIRFLCAVYACYLVFQLFSHKELYEDRYQDEGGDIYRSAHYPKGRTILYKPQWLRDSRRRSHDVTIAVIQNAGPVIQPIDERMGDAYEIARIASGPRTMDDAEPASSSSPSGSDVGSFRRHSNADVEVQQQTVEPEGIEAPQMSMPLTIGLLVIVTALVAVTAEWLVGSINGLTDSGHIKKQWVGLILLPIVSNAAEHATAVSVSVKDKLTLSLSVAIGAGIVRSSLWRACLCLECAAHCRVLTSSKFPSLSSRSPSSSRGFWASRSRCCSTPWRASFSFSLSLLSTIRPQTGRVIGSRG